MSYDLGIDVGTSYTAAATRTPDGAVSIVGLGPVADSIPSVIHLAEDGTVTVGHAANRRAALDPTGVAREFKRRMGDPTPLFLRSSPFSAEALMARMLNHVMERVVELEGETPDRIVVTHPANWGPYKLELLGQALHMAELEHATTLNEPAAAAHAYAAQTRIPVGATVAVYDLGGGTFDAAVLRKLDDDFGGLGESTGIEHLGGVDFDDAILEHVRRQVGPGWPSDPDDPALPAPMVHLRRACREAKELLSTEDHAVIPVLLPGVDTTISLERWQLEAMIRPRIEESLRSLDAAISSAGISPTGLTAVLLVGGSSRIPLVRSILREQYGDRVARDVDPLYAVARGAAVAAGSGRSDAAGPAPAVVSPTPAPAPAPTAGSVRPDAQVPAPTIQEPPGNQRVPAVSASGPPAVSTRFTRGAQPPAVPPTATDRPSPEGRRRQRVLLLPALVGFVLLVGLVGLFMVQSDNGSREPDSQAAASEAPGSLPSADGMVGISAGTYSVGTDNPETNASETTTRSEDVAAYVIDTYEVTNEQYKAFIDQQAAEPPFSWPGGEYPEDLARHPAQGVSYDWASAYCTALNKRLPTEIEWEVAARGSDARLYPWGDDVDAVQLPTFGTYEVGSIAGNVSPFGVFDLTGNVWEWVSDPYDSRVVGDERVLRGGENGYLREAVTRNQVVPAQSNALKRAGFRCAADEADAAVEPLIFEPVDAPDTPTVPRVDLPEGVLYYDDFTDQTSGWFEDDQDLARQGYHPNRFFHLETKAPEQEELALGPYALQPGAPFSIETTDAAPVSRLTKEGDYAYGLAFRFDSDGRGLIFIVRPAASQWLVCERFLRPDGTPDYVLLEDSTRVIPHDVDLEVRARADDHYEFLIDDRSVHTRHLPGYAGDDATGAGFIVISYNDNEKAHIHFDDFKIAELQ